MRLAHRGEAVRLVLRPCTPPSRSGRSRGRAAGPRTPARARAVELVARRGRPRRARAGPAARGRSAPCRRTSRRRAGRASARGRGTACGRRRRCPVACRCPRGYGQIQTSFHAGGIPSSRMRSRSSGSSIRSPSSSRYSKPLPRPRRVIPGPEQSDRRSRVIPYSLPARRRFKLAHRAMPTLDFETTPERDRRGDRRDRRARPLRRRAARGRARAPGPPSRSSRTVVLDLRGLEFMDSSGLRLVVLADMRAREAGRRFALVRGDRDRAPRVRDHAHERPARLRRPTRRSSR